MASSHWQSHNSAPIPEDPSFTSVSLVAPPGTDIWRRSDQDDVFNAPILYRSLPASQFKSITVTVFAPWRTQYDQGGLVISFPTAPNQPRKWIKAGIEFFDLQAALGVVGTDRYSDWSLSPMSQEHHQKATFRAVKHDTTLWIHAGQAGSEKLLPMREVKWAFMEGRNEGDIWVGVYAAKPQADEGDENEGAKGIEVSFSDLEIETTE